ncbi:MAG: Ppx/GppA phosphatase family protein [Planctomycetota bacterium]
MTEAPPPLDDAALAAVDLGSNSFHLVVARETEGRPRIIDKLRERVALAEGLNAGQLDAVVQARALATLERFRERLRVVPPDRVRAVGTATFRKLRDGEAFLRLASEALGASIEVVPGSEEARLVYLGVAHALGDDEGRRLVVDIGGGSTECILGTRFVSERGDSLAMGCVTWSRRYFPGGTMTPSAFDTAELAARVELEPVARSYGRSAWDHAIGSSGTIRAVAEILERMGWGDGTIGTEGLARLRGLLEDVCDTRRLELEGMRPDRRDVLVGGVAVLRAVFESLGVEVMRPSTGALREGALHDLLGRIHHEDVRESSARAFIDRLGLDAGHGRRCRVTAEALFDQVAPSLGLVSADRLLLGWAAMLHTIGLVVSHSGYHKHGAYLAEHADLAGFSSQDRRQIALLIRGQRRRLRPDLLAGLPDQRLQSLRCLLPLLRISLRLHRDRTDRELPMPKLRASGSRFRLTFPDGWLDAHPLTRADLEQESRQLDAFGIVLDLA